ncbi:hypothetical protein L486_07682 [Kwoniella mangroviensis CBS 10435]|uniref:Uncharacterized protein n=1 Tax=Kwoniella mangroviensis CBS 10435 TaxID=1331196 RepID=A0A1B9IHC4_9TREE|nr:hypothetical protein L486_07682 [Kwoniella mangroviensis CBS 10435]
MALVSTHAPTTLNPSSMGGHYADTTSELFNTDGTFTETAKDEIASEGYRLLSEIANSASDLEPEDTSQIMRDRVRRTIFDREDLAEDPTLDSRLSSWASKDSDAASRATAAYNELMGKRDLFRLALHGVMGPAEKPSLGDGNGPLPSSWTSNSIAPPGHAEYPSDETWTTEQGSRALVPRTVKSAEEMEDELATGYNQVGIPTHLLQNLRRTGKTPHPMALTTVGPSFDEDTLVPYTGAGDILNGFQHTDTPIRTTPPATSGYSIPRTAVRRGYSGQDVPTALSRIGQMWRSMVSQMDQDRSEAIEWRQDHPDGGMTEGGDAEEVTDDGEKTQVSYRTGRFRNGSFSSYTSISTSGGPAGALPQGMNPMMRSILPS